ncbi:hypothetical protein ABW21_db0208118 [Orbilia brochopaga]|nr:hypothetical protein ABW21_db0208118 [Drechslerella brochopaga]
MAGSADTRLPSLMAMTMPSVPNPPQDKHVHRIYFFWCRHRDAQYVFRPADDDPTRCVCSMRDRFFLRFTRDKGVRFQLEWRIIPSLCDDCYVAQTIRRRNDEREHIAMVESWMQLDEDEAGDVELEGVEGPRPKRPRLE